MKVSVRRSQTGLERRVSGSIFALRSNSAVLLACLTILSDGCEPSTVQIADTTLVLLPEERPPAPQHDGSSALDAHGRLSVNCALQCDSSCPTAAEFPVAVVPAQAADTPDDFTSDERVIEAKRTPLSGTEAAKNLERAYRRRLGRRPSRETLALLTAHWAHETNRGASMFNYNFGGIKGVGPDGSYVVERTREGFGPSERRKNHRFRAYRNAMEGAMDYLSLLHRLYRPALDAAALGDVPGFVKGLKQGGYFSGDEQLYLQKVTVFIASALSWGFDALGPSGISPLHKATRETALGR